MTLKMQAKDVKPEHGGTPDGPAAASEGNAQHHNAGARIPDGGYGIAAAESEVGELSQASRMYFDPVPKCDALSARLALCEERCKELEAGIEKHRRDAGDVYQFANDRELWSLLAPKGEGGKP